MLHTKFQGHRLLGSGEEDFFFRFLPYMGKVAILVMWPAPFNKFLLPHPKEAPLWNLASIGPVVSEEKMFENVDNYYTHTYIHAYIHTHIHTYTHIYTYIHEAFLYYQLKYEPKRLRRAKKKLLSKERIYIQWRTRISQWWAPLSSMPMIPIYCKNLKESSSPEPHADDLETWYAASGARVLPCLFK